VLNILKVIKTLKKINMFKVIKKSKTINISRQATIVGSRGSVKYYFHPNGLAPYKV
jgi:hypothetical protein